MEICLLRKEFSGNFTASDATSAHSQSKTFHTSPPQNMKTSTAKKVMSSALAATLCTGTLLSDDGTGEKGFVPPPREMKKPPAPPRVASSAETVLACCCCPVTPMSRTEAKKPPQPPVLITKIKEESAGTGKK